MMENTNYLYIDCSQELTLGFLDYQFQFLQQKNFSTGRCGDILHTEIFNILDENKLKFKDISGVFFVMGPGSYTGLRFGKGMMDVLQKENISCFSFHWFDLPWLLEIKNEYTFTANAFKGESLILKMKDGDILDHKLILNDLLEKELLRVKEKNWTVESIKKELFCVRSSEIFKNVKKYKLQRDIYYFRSDLEEFKPNA